jgi:hypothetical protein
VEDAYTVDVAGAGPVRCSSAAIACILGAAAVLIENMSQDIFESALANPSNMSRDENKKLVFDKVGDQYFLKKIVSTSTAVEFPKSESEKRALTLQRQSFESYAKTVTRQ